MAPRDNIINALEGHSQCTQNLDKVFAVGWKDSELEGDWYKSSCDFGRWLTSQNFSPPEGAEDQYHQLLAIHEDYHRALMTVFRLHENNSPTQARTYFEGEFKEKSLKLTAELLKWMELFNEEEIQRYETL